MSRKQSVRSRPGKKAELERKRDERAARRALAKERRNRAGEEAAGDPQEFLSFANQLRVLGLRLREVPGDGNCLFRALGDQLEGHSRDHLRHRQETADYMVKHRHHFQPFVEDDVPFDRHVENLAQPGTFAGNDAIVAFARNNQVNVVIHQLNNPLWQIRGSDKGNARELHIAYRYGEHYDSVRSGQDNTESPAHLQTEMFSKDVSNRKNKPKSDVPEERAEWREDAVQKVRNATSCADARLILQSLEAERYDIEAAIQMVLQIEQLKQIGDADCVAEGSDCSYSSATWEPSDCEGSETQRRTPTPHREPPEHRKQSRQSRSEDDTQEQNKKNSNQKVSNKQRKDQQRLEKKKRQEERHRQKVQDQRGNNTDNNRQGDGDAVTVVKALSTLNI